MARDAATILAELVALSPWWLRPIVVTSAEVVGELAGGAVSKTLDGLAAVLALGEVTRDAWIAQARRSTASGAYLDSIGAELGRSRWPAETDDAYRARLVRSAEGATVAALREALDAYATHIGWPGAAPRLSEPRHLYCDDTSAEHGLFADDWRALALPEDGPARLAWLHLPEIGALTSDPDGWSYADSAYCDDTSAALGEAFTLEDWRDPVSRWIYRDFLAIAGQYRPAGVAMGATIEDRALVSDEVLALLMQQGGGSIL